MSTTIEAIKITAVAGSVALAVGVIKLNTARRPHSRDRTTRTVTVTSKVGLYTREGSPVHLEALKFSDLFTFTPVKIEADVAFAEDLEFGFAALPAQPAAVAPQPVDAPALLDAIAIEEDKRVMDILEAVAIADSIPPVEAATPAEADENKEPVISKPKANAKDEPKPLKFGHARK